MSADLIAFLKARLDEDEQIAKDGAFTRGPDWHLEEQEAYVWGEDPVDAVVLATGKPIAVCDDEHGGHLVAEHIARHDPARVLAEGVAMRALIDQVERWQHDDPDEGGYYACPAVRTEPLGDLPGGPGECMCGLLDRQRAVLAPFAAVHADHPGYDKRWLP